ncbi:class I SAM-dependent methyltransferase [[Limnothrix rosea] IAM M-220]|uniref:class I SAM-dependent methyltransferase n=1 Tax=[Limnothrix rosea] IAM M-220 TaxID=454133 RepID=UPI0028F43C83|nr:class I SAM-dependent methyltransferase [[Limnothrix rosea] IAM M-220]
MVRILEPEVMDDPAEAIAYDAMDFSDVNQDFANLVVQTYGGETAKVLDLGTGTARIPIFVAQQRPQWQIIATDLAPSMLAVGQKNIEAANVTGQIQLQLADSKQLPFGDRTFDVIMSNSLIHHLPDPLPCFQEMRRLLKPQGVIILRDLFRPTSVAKIDDIIAGVDDADFDPHQLKLFRDSLFAAFTVEEIQAIADQTGLATAKVEQTSERHWTLVFVD